MFLLYAVYEVYPLILDSEYGILYKEHLIMYDLECSLYTVCSLYTLHFHSINRQRGSGTLSKSVPYLYRNIDRNINIIYIIYIYIIIYSEILILILYTYT